METLSHSFTPEFETSIVSSLYRDPAFAKRLLPCMDQWQFAKRFNGAYLQEMVGWRKWWEKENPNEPLARSTVQQWAHEWTKGQPQNHEYHTQAWDRLLWEVYEGDHNPAFVKDMAIDWVQSREVDRILTEAKSSLSQGEIPDSFGLVQKIRDVELIRRSAVDLGMTFGIDPAAEYTRWEHTPPRDVLPLGIKGIDSICSGGMGRQELWVPAAPPNTGKTTVLSNWAARWCSRGYNVAYYTLEHKVEQVFEKAVCSLANQTPEQLRQSPGGVQQWTNWMYNHGGKMLLQEYPMGRATVDDIYAHLCAAESVYGMKFDVVLIDYADNMRLDTKIDAHRHQLSRIYTDLKGMAQEKDVLVVTPTQTNRGSVSKDFITIEDVAEDFQKAAIADGIISLCQSEEEVREGIMRMFFAKNRHGEKFGTVKMRINPALARMEEIEAAAIRHHGQAPIQGAQAQYAALQRFNAQDAMQALYGAAA